MKIGLPSQRVLRSSPYANVVAVCKSPIQGHPETSEYNTTPGSDGLLLARFLRV